MGTEALAAVKQVARQYVKSAAVTQEDFYQAVQELSSRQLQEQALRNAGTVGLAGLGIGAGTRGLMGLLQLGRRNLAQRKKPKQPLSIVDLHLPPKQAGISSFLAGDMAKSTKGIPWAMPAAVAAGGAGLYGGWKGIDYLLDSRRKADIDNELAEARKDYERALEEPKDGIKSSVAHELSTSLNELVATFEKAAFDLGDTAGQAAGAYGLYGGASAIGAALAAYGWGRKRQRKALIEKAQKKLQRQRYAAQPPALFAGPRTTPGEEEINSDMFAEI